MPFWLVCSLRLCGTCLGSMLLFVVVLWGMTIYFLCVAYCRWEDEVGSSKCSFNGFGGCINTCSKLFRCDDVCASLVLNLYEGCDVILI